MSKIEGAAGSVSWIDQNSPAGSGATGVSDPQPAAQISEGFMLRTGNEAFRFSNYLRAWITTEDGKTVKSQGLDGKSGMYRAPSFGSISSEPYPTTTTDTKKSRADGVEYIEFIQTTGARTRSHESFGTIVGAVAGGLVGAAAGAKIGAKIGAIGGPKGFVAGLVIGAVVGGVIGLWAARKLFNFPPIWTVIALRLHADEKVECELVKHSLFPSVSFYCDPGATGNLQRRSEYSALAAEQQQWQDHGWDTGNPWSVPRP